LTTTKEQNIQISCKSKKRTKQRIAGEALGPRPPIIMQQSKESSFSK
jgi:hypothetical protein